MRRHLDPQDLVGQPQICSCSPHRISQETVSDLPYIIFGHCLTSRSYHTASTGEELCYPDTESNRVCARPPRVANKDATAGCTQTFQSMGRRKRRLPQRQIRPLCGRAASPTLHRVAVFSPCTGFHCNECTGAYILAPC
jgi:hypothetical protein